MSCFEVVSALAPAVGPLGVAAAAGQIGPPVGGHPAQDGRGGEVLGFAADLPDSLVGVSAVGQCLLHQSAQPLPHRVDDPGGPRLEVGVHPVEEHAPHVVLVLVPGAVADPDRTGPLVPRKVVQGPFGEIPLAPDAVHDLELERLVVLTLGDRLQHEGEVLECLPVEAQAIERSQHEPGVPDPGVAVVPVAGPARCLGEGRRRGGHDRPGRRVAQALEGQGTALDVGAPRVVGELPAGQPVTPVGHRGVDIPVGLVLVGRGDSLPPRQGHEALLTLGQAGAPVATGAGLAQSEAAHQGKRQVAIGGSDGEGAVAITVIRPLPGSGPIVEQRYAVGDRSRPLPKRTSPSATGRRQRRHRWGRAGTPVAGCRRRPCG